MFSQATWYLSFLLHRQDFSIPNFTPKKWLKHPKTLKMSLKKYIICSFCVQSEIFYTWQNIFTRAPPVVPVTIIRYGYTECFSRIVTEIKVIWGQQSSWSDKTWSFDHLQHCCSADEKFDGTYPTNVVVTNEGHCTYIPPGIFKVLKKWKIFKVLKKWKIFKEYSRCSKKWNIIVWSFSVHLPDWHHMVPFRRPELWDEVRKLDLQWF